jgi:hypothetical protein
LYARVSTSDQDVQVQVDELRVEAEPRGWKIVGTYTDEGVSGRIGPIRGVRTFTHVSVGHDRACALETSGQVRCWPVTFGGIGGMPEVSTP